MKKPFILRIWVVLSSSLFLFAFLNFVGCKSSQPNAPQETQGLMKIDSFAPTMGFPGATGSPGTIVKIYGRGFGSDANRVRTWYGTRTSNKVTPDVTDSIITSHVPYIPPGKYPIIVSFDSTIIQSKDSFTVLTNPFIFTHDTIEFHDVSLNQRSIIDTGKPDTTFGVRLLNYSLPVGNFDSSYSYNGNSDHSYQSSSYHRWLNYTIDTQLMQLPTLEYIDQYSSGSGGSMLGSTRYSDASTFWIKLKNVSWTYTSDRNILATITAKDFSSQVVLISNTSVSTQSNPNFYGSNKQETIGMNPPSSDSYIIIKFNH